MIVSIFKMKKQFFGFTLLELLIALAIFSVMAILGYSGLKTVLDARAQIEQYANKLADLQMAFTWISRDIQHYVDREIRNQFGDKEPALKGTAMHLELTRAGWRNPAQQRRSHLQRVAYFFNDRKLWRSYWWTLDRAQEMESGKIDLLEGVESLNFRFLDSRLQWHEQWPPVDFLKSEFQTESKIKNPPMLKAIEVTLTVPEWGRLTRLFAVVETWNIEKSLENKAE
jgi:general secretion pathway protein J